MTITTKHYLWIVHLAVLGLIIWTGVNLAMTVLEARLETSARNRPSAAPPRTMNSDIHGQKDYDAIYQNNMFSTRRGLAPEGSPTAEDSGRPSADIIKAGLHLVGTIAGSTPELSFAIIKIEGQAEQELFRPGDSVGQARLVEVKNGEVTLQEGGRTIKLMLEDMLASAATPGSGQEPARSGPVLLRPEAGDRIARPVGPNQYIVSRDILNQDMSNLYDFMSQVTIQPNFEGEKPHGFRIASIQRDGIFAQLGLRRNDVIMKMNGVEVSQPDDIMGIYQQLEQLDTLTLDIERGRRPLTFTYSLK